MSALPPWVDSMSDGCSGPQVMSDIPATRACCVRHDEKYYYGGSAAARLRADRAFYACLRLVGLPIWRAYIVYYSVRLFGGPKGRKPGVSWAFGGEIFAYTDDK